MPLIKRKPEPAKPRRATPRQRMKDFRAHIPILIEKKNYIVKTADSTEELHQALKLRHEVFLTELLHRSKKSGMDRDRFDKSCDHLLIIDKRDNTVIGTYRLQSSLHTKRWYTATEFHMRRIVKNLPGNKLELGRACVHPDHRNGITIALLWEGIAAYMTASHTTYMFGCSSIKTMDRDEIRQIYYYLKQNGHTTDIHHVSPKVKFRVPGMKRHVRRHPIHPTLMDHGPYREKIPSLLHSYLRAGAKVCGIPALDKSFRCIDFLTILDVRDLGRSYSRSIPKE